jgi:hypothetical protein
MQNKELKKLHNLGMIASETSYVVGYLHTKDRPESWRPSYCTLLKELHSPKHFNHCDEAHHNSRTLTNHVHTKRPPSYIMDTHVEITEETTSQRS